MWTPPNDWRTGAAPKSPAQETCDFQHCGLSFSVSAGFYSDGRIGELFLSSNKPGSPIEAIARDAAILLSIALQHGADIQTIKHALTKDHDGAPATLVGSALGALSLIPFPREDPIT